MRKILIFFTGITNSKMREWWYRAFINRFASSPINFSSALKLLRIKEISDTRFSLSANLCVIETFCVLAFLLLTFYSSKQTFTRWFSFSIFRHSIRISSLRHPL